MVSSSGPPIHIQHQRLRMPKVSNTVPKFLTGTEAVVLTGHPVTHLYSTLLYIT